MASSWVDRLRQPGLSVALEYFLLAAVPIFWRWQMGWASSLGILSDLSIAALLVFWLHGRSRLWGVLAVGLWLLCWLGCVEMVKAVARMPEFADLHYLADSEFLGNSAGSQSAGLSHPWFAALMLLAGFGAVWLGRAQKPLKAAWLALPIALLVSHSAWQYYKPSDATPWQQFNLPHKWLAEGVSQLSRWLPGQDEGQSKNLAQQLARLDLDGERLFEGRGRARNVLVITLEGISGAYIDANRRAAGFKQNISLMPKLSAWAERGMSTSDLVLHSHQTIRGLYALLCGDYSKLDGSTPKGMELLNNPARAEQCLPAQLAKHGFSTHFLQGAGLRFMAKEQVMPRMGFTQTHGQEWFTEKKRVPFAWGPDDGAFFQGALRYVKGLRATQKPWMLTLLTVGTHQPYAAPKQYLARFTEPKQASVAYLDDQLDQFLTALERLGVLKDTLVVITSDESHGLDGLRLSSAWGLNILLAPEQSKLPALKGGVYGELDLPVSILDYFDLPIPGELSGRSLLRDYAHGRPMISYTNGFVRYHDGNRRFVECDFQRLCRSYDSEGFVAAQVKQQGSASRSEAGVLLSAADMLNQSLSDPLEIQRFQFASVTPVVLKSRFGNDWTDNLIGAQYLSLPAGSRTKVSLTVRALRLGKQGAQLWLKAKEFDQDIDLGLPELPKLSAGKPLKLEFDFTNEQARKAFSFHLLGAGHGRIEITDFSVVTEPLDQSEPAERLAGPG